jgi:type VII secretion-associated serine protease mycosin
MISLAQRMAALLLVLLGAVPGPGAQDEIRDEQWHLDYLRIDQAHRISTGTGVIVAVIDTGVDGTHPDLSGRLLPGEDFSIEHLPNALTDRDGHGTAMAGLIAARGRALGIAPDATILPVRRSTYGASFLGVADAIDWAIDHDASVLCLAFSDSQPDQASRAAIARAITKGVVVVAGVGNTPDKSPQYPASYPGVVGVAGIDRGGNHADISIESPAALLAAPAVDITSTGSRMVAPSGYRVGTGTSDATAIIAGVAALVRAKFPDLSAQEVIHRMTATAVDRGPPGRDDLYGYGIVDPVAALTANVPPLTPTSTPQAVADHEGWFASRTAIVAVSIGASVLILTGLVLALRRRTR